jgi:hypothetical protein
MTLPFIHIPLLLYMPTVTLIGLDPLMIAAQRLAFAYSLIETLFLGVPKSNPQFLVLAPKPNTAALLSLVPRSSGSNTFFKSYTSSSILLQLYGVTTWVLLFLLLTQCFTLESNMWKSITTLFENK